MTKIALVALVAMIFQASALPQYGHGQGQGYPQQPNIGGGNHILEQGGQGGYYPSQQHGYNDGQFGGQGQYGGQGHGHDEGHGLLGVGGHGQYGGGRGSGGHGSNGHGGGFDGQHGGHGGRGHGNHGHSHGHRY